MKIRTVMPVLALSSALALAGCGDDGSTDGMDMGSPSAPAATPSQGPPGSAGSTAASAEHDEADVMFLQMMHPHHAQATEMAQMVSGRTDDQAVLDLADQIAQAQGPEMEQMASLLESFGEPAPSVDMGAMEGMDHSGSGSMTGMMSEQDMTSLESAEGEAFDRMWLSMMVEHHTGAVEMARTELEDGADPEVRQLATDITASQQAEITTMQGLLEQL